MELFLLILLLVIATGIFIWTIYNLIGEFSAVAFVPSEKSEIEHVFEEIDLKKGKVFFDLGSGDGRVVRAAAERYGVRGVGYEIHPLLVWYSRLKSIGMSNVEYRISSLWNADLEEADYIYCYLSPKAMKKLAKKMKSECRKGTLVVSKVFEIKTMRQKQEKVLTVNNRNFYIYRM